MTNDRNDRYLEYLGDRSLQTLNFGRVEYTRTKMTQWVPIKYKETSKQKNT